MENFARNNNFDYITSFSLRHLVIKFTKVELLATTIIINVIASLIIHSEWSYILGKQIVFLSNLNMVQKSHLIVQNVLFLH
jgi:hypothetical protein